MKPSNFSSRKKSTPITYIINKYFKNDIYSQIMKKEIMSTVYKSGCQLEIFYRLVTIISTISQQIGSDG